MTKPITDLEGRLEASFKRADKKVAELVIEKGRLYIVYTSRFGIGSKTDVTPVWHFFKEVQENLARPSHE